ncbi:MAG: Sulfite reductase [ferredoxin] [Phycisphaerae bacterium]|nr:Sulfite reductase [ferredoxin] [Phycisphaerae bacterium]
MLKIDAPQPSFHTPDDQLCKEELIKAASNGVRGTLYEDFRDASSDEISSAMQQVAKSHGIYTEYNRASTGRQKDWMYMVRMSIPGGGPLGREQWAILDDLSERMTAGPDIAPSLRVTTRQNIQFHWVKKHDVVEMVRTIARTGFYTMNGCGDNARNVMACPLARFSDVFNGHALAHEVAGFFQVAPAAHIQIFEIDPQFVRSPETRFDYGDKLLNRKFKVAFAAVHRDPQTGQLHRDNCVEARTNDVGLVPVIDGDAVRRLQVYVGGGQGEKNGKATFPAHGQPLGIIRVADTVAALNAIATIHKEWGDRKNRHWARLKYVVWANGVQWWRQQLRDAGVDLDEPDASVEPGPRMMHHGWTLQPSNGRWAYGAWIENGRLQDGPRGQFKSMVRHMLEKYDGVSVTTTPNQDLLFTDISAVQKQEFEADLARFGQGRVNGKPASRLRTLSGACVGLYTCRLSYTESEQFEPELMDELERRGYGDVAESVGITGCERQCFRPATKTLGWVGQGPDLYALKLGGSEDGRRQGAWVIAADADGVSERWFLRQVPRGQVADVCAALFDFYRAGRQSERESMGEFHHRVGSQAIVDHLRSLPALAPLLEKSHDPPFVPQDYRF